jgi:hypothetical protein
MATYKELVNGKIVVTNVKGLFGTRIEVYDEKEIIQMQQSACWTKAIEKIKSL